MAIQIECKEDVAKYFSEKLGYEDNAYFNYEKAKMDIGNIDEIKSMHLISDTKGFKVWLFEVDEIETNLMNRVANKLYNANPFAYNLLFFADKDYRNYTLLHYHKENNENLKIRRLNIKERNFTKTDYDIINGLSLKNKRIVDDLDIELEYRKAFSIEKVTKDFFEEFKNEIDNFEKNIKGLKEKDDRRSYAILLINRMIFLYFIQEKGWLNGKKDYLYDRFLYCEEHNPKLNYYDEILKPLFFECLNIPVDKGFIKNRSERAKKLYENFESQTDLECDPKFHGIPYLNGQLFERHEKYEIDTDIKINNEVFKKLFDNLLNKYNFTVREDLGYDADIAVDPELLGRIFENMINVEERKKTGSFYTPRPIINYMCKQSLKEYLLDNIQFTAPEKIIYLIDNIEDENLYSQNRIVKVERNYRVSESTDGRKYRVDKLEAKEILNLLDRVKICDPAVGSGAFILGMLQLLLLIKKKLNYYAFNRNIDLYETKKNIIEKNLYGIDIQEEAVEISHLRLWLSLTVEYEARSIEDVKPLPNFNYKIIQGNSLISQFGGVDFDEKIDNIKDVLQTTMFSIQFQDEFSIIIANRNAYFNATTNKKEIEKEIFEAEFSIIKRILQDINKYESDEQVTKIVKNKEDYCSWILSFPEVFVDKPDKDKGFDIIIGNPPYVNTKDVNKLQYKDVLHNSYGYKDDLYNYFVFRGMSRLKNKGVLAYITSDTFLTIQTKLNLRELLQDKYLKELIITPKAFDALVDTVIFIVKNQSKKSIDYSFEFIDASNGTVNDFLDLKSSNNINRYNPNIKLYRNNLMKVFFKPDNINMQIYQKHIPKVKRLYNKWWDKIDNSRKIRQNVEVLDSYRKSLKSGVITLLGLITEGGQGLATGDNGKFVGVIEGSKIADRIKIQRVDKFYNSIIKDEERKQEVSKWDSKYKNIETKNGVERLFNTIGENEIRHLFDKCKEKFGRNIFGRGFIFRIISEEEIADVSKLSKEEIENGIDDNKRVYVPYDKGDKDGNRWYLETPYYLNWSREAVEFLVSNSGKSGGGMPVVRNKDYYFREGFCWTDVNSIYLKARVKSKSVYDVLSMSLFSMIDENKITEKYIVALINSKFMSEFVQEFLNGTSHFQINDARKIPIIIPNKKQLSFVNNLVDDAIEIKKLQFSEQISYEKAEEELDEIQNKIDKFVYDLYDIKLE